MTILQLAFVLAFVLATILVYPFWRHAFRFKLLPIVLCVKCRRWCRCGNGIAVLIKRCDECGRTCRCSLFKEITFIDYDGTEVDMTKGKPGTLHYTVEPPEGKT
ncbi:hypothetical protein BT63DRAFT_440520 [Microthyrium microscopicum]|uniref:Uncharacterized protein n=1 Tax=Microthyrium microscopicum TaxID=703497 RepID=A0A6A6UB60_9PEZI|nr:hypothetical protein BT63DRAFT_440520 [Microthyrium microscopicum]